MEFCDFWVEYRGEDNPMRFMHGRHYLVTGKQGSLYQIVDETGEPYLYSLDNFVIVPPDEGVNFVWTDSKLS